MVLSTQNELVFAIGNGATASGIGAYGDGTIRLRLRVAAESRRSVAGARAPAPAASELSPEADGPLPKAEELSPVADGARPTANALFAEANKSRPMAREARPIAMALFTAKGLSAVPLPAWVPMGGSVSRVTSRAGQITLPLASPRWACLGTS